MKRIFFAVAAICSMSLWSCDNDLDNNELTPVEQEMLKLDEMIASQSGFDEAALLADLTNGTMIWKKIYYYSSEGSLVDEDMDGDARNQGSVFFEDGTGADYWFLGPNFPDPVCKDFTWRYDSSISSLITHDPGYSMTYDGEYIYYDECSAKVLYYNSEDHCLILEGALFNTPFLGNTAKARMVYYIDLDPATRERVLELCDNE